jgi:4-hydroxybenzoate polyprenyltransferase
VLVDVITLAGLYTIRIIAGTMALSLELSFWLLAFSMFVFLSLAIVKRYSELLELKNRSDGVTISSRGYLVSDLELLTSLGGSSGYIAVLVLALYVHSQEIAGLYAQPELLWLCCPLFLFWISRVWVIAHRGLMHDDPIVWAIKDRGSYAIGSMIFLVAAFAI